MMMDWAAELDSSFKAYQDSRGSSFFNQGLAKRSKADEDDSGPVSKRAKPSSRVNDEEIRRHYEKETLHKVSFAISYS
jgi:hypothetical protein